MFINKYTHQYSCYPYLTVYKRLNMLVKLFHREPNKSLDAKVREAWKNFSQRKYTIL